MSTLKCQIAPVATLEGHEDRAWAVAWNPTRLLLASCSGDKTVRIYNYGQKRSLANEGSSDSTEKDEKDQHLFFTLQTSVPTGHTKSVRCVAWAPSGKTFATGSFDSNIAVWEQEDAAADDEMDGYNGTELGMAGKHGEWECASLLEGHETECKGVAYSCTGTLLASCSRDKSVWVWEVQPDAEFECMGVLMAHMQDVKCVAWHPTEEILASGSYDDTIKLYVDDPSDDWYDFQTLTGHTSTVWSLAFSPNGALLASASDDLTIRIWRRTEKWHWEQVAVLEGYHSRSIYSVSWTQSDDGKESDESDMGWLASASGDGTIHVWSISMQGGTVLNELIAAVQDAHGVSDVNCVSWCPREGFRRLLASAGDDCTVRVWELSSSKE